LVRGPKQKVISFTFFESEIGGSLYKRHNPEQRQYFNGIKLNLLAARELYGPEWTMRLYYKVNKTRTSVIQQLCDLACTYPNLDICKVDTHQFGEWANLHPFIWRFFPLIDPDVDIMFSRDLDSLISSREVFGPILGQGVKTLFKATVLLSVTFFVCTGRGSLLFFVCTGAQWFDTVQ
jgi:hypothetical protein